MKIKVSDGLILVGIASITLVNPLTGQYFIKGIILAYEQLLLISDYFMVAGLVLVCVGFLLGKQEQRQKNTAKFKKLKTQKTEKAGKFID